MTSPFGAAVLRTPPPLELNTTISFPPRSAYLLPMPEILTLEHFAPYVGQQFHVRFDAAAPSPLTLIEAVPLFDGPAPGRSRAAFALLFRERSQHARPQALYSVEHEAIGAHDIFLVPLGVDSEGARYQAVFN